MGGMGGDAGARGQTGWEGWEVTLEPEVRVRHGDRIKRLAGREAAG